jgi:DNA primase
MSNRFSKHTLFDIRNRIDINALIRDTLKMPNKLSEGFLRFLCPLCSDFNTATNPKTNLARCFHCKRNFNTIDLVMIVTEADFKETVSFLSDLLN